MEHKLLELYPEKDKCLEKRKTSAEGKNKTFNILCDSQIKETIVKVRIDGCLITDQNIKKCDWMFLIPESKVLILVECKGNNVMKAIEQIRSTLRILRQVVDLSSERYAFVIPTNVAPAIQSEIMREMKKLGESLGLN